MIGNLQNLAEDLHSLQLKYGKCVQRDQGLVLHPKTTSSAERALQLKRKYKRLNQHISHYKSLPTKLGGRPRVDASYRNRVGRKAANKRKVQVTFIHQYTSMCIISLYSYVLSYKNSTLRQSATLPPVEKKMASHSHVSLTTFMHSVILNRHTYLTSICISTC